MEPPEKELTMDLTKFITISLTLVLSSCAGAHDDLANVERVLLAMCDATSGKSQFEWSQAIRAVDMSGAPVELREAIVAFVHTNDQMTRAHNEWKAFREYADSEMIWQSAIRGFLGDPLGETEDAMARERRIQRDLKQSHERFADAWHRVEQVAAKYNTNPPCRYYLID